MITKNSIQVFIVHLIVFFLCSCSGTEHKYEYYNNGKVKSVAEVVRGERNGELLEYYEDGSLKSRSYWVNGQMNGPFVYYYPNGKISKSGYLREFEVVEMKLFYESGEIQHIQRYDSLGDILSVERFHEDGSRDSTAYPFMRMQNFRDTVYLGDIAIFKAKIVNVYDSIFRHGKLIITSRFDSSTNDIRIVDTLKIIRPTNDFDFEYHFLTEKEGNQVLYGEFIFVKDVNETMLIHSIQFDYHFVARKR